MDLVVLAYGLAAKLPATERFELAAQMRRAAVSVPSNIAEGQASGPGRRYLFHLRVALGSLAELETQLEIVRRLRWVSADDLQRVDDLVARTGRLLHGTARSVRRALMARPFRPTDSPLRNPGPTEQRGASNEHRVADTGQRAVRAGNE